MGHGPSSAAGGTDVRATVLGGVYASAGGIVGGGKPKEGLDLVEDYANSVYSKAKKELILKLASAASSVMQMGKKSFSNVEDAVAFLVKNVPNPKKGDKIKPGASLHKDVCEALASEINAAYGTKLISTDGDNARVCNEVAEIVHSLVQGLHMEFAGVAADVDQVSKNLMVLLSYLEQNHLKYSEIISASNDPEIKSNSEIVTKFYEKLIEEVKRQLAVLNNIVGNVIGPVGKNLVELVEKSDSFKGMVENIKNELGTKEFGEKLGYVLSGVSDSAQAAKIVEQALQTIGMSIQDYRNTKGVEDLRNKIFEALEKSDKRLGGEELVKFMRAADVLYRYDFRQPQIIEHLKKSGGVDPDAPAPVEESADSDKPVEVKVEGGGCGCEGADGGRPNFGVVGGQGEDAAHIFERKTDLKQSLAVKSRELDRFREELFNDFEKSMLTHYRNVVGLVAQIGPKLGNEIPINENVREFVRHFASMDETNRNNIARALSGYNKSGASLANRNRFIADFAKLLTLAAPLAPKSALFKDLENEIKELNSLIEVFGEKFVKALQSPLNPRVKGPYAKGGDDASGGDAEGGDFVPSTISTGTAEKYASFKKAKLQLTYHMAIANIKKSMARAATDDIGTDEAYKTMMGQSVAQMIKIESAKMKEINDRLDVMAKSGAGIFAVATTEAKALVEKTRELAKRQFTAKKELLECAQNIDLYLRAFTVDAVAKPDQLIKLSSVLQQFVNIRKFYTKTAGDNLVDLFEQFPRPAGAAAHEEGKDYLTQDLNRPGAQLSNHRSQLNLLDAAGNIDANAEKKVDKFVKKLDDAVYGIRALENVLLAFAQIGNEQTDKTFMSHGKVLKVLTDYIAASAYSIRAKKEAARARVAGADADAAATGSDFQVSVNQGTQYADGAAAFNENNKAGVNQILNIVLNQLHAQGLRADDNGGYVDDFKETNKVFEYILKAICGKVLTVLGLYSIYNMPNADYMSISAVRTILGGGAEKPVIIPEALELYVRLPLLAEWLRSSFVNVDPAAVGDPLSATANYAIAMIPDTTSPWSELLKIFLVKTSHITDGNYSESDVYAIVNEINKIYTAYREKSPEDTAYAAMEGLVKDFNSRYGIMKTNEIKEYMAKYRNQEDYSALDAKGRDEDFTNFDLLDSKNARSSGAAPSDRYLETSTITTASGLGWTTESALLIKKLHYNIARKFKDAHQVVLGNQNINDSINFTSTIHGVVEQYKYELAAASSNDEKVKIVAKAIQSVGMYSNENPSKFFMFHEMVVSPLYSLFRLFQILRQFIASYDALTRLVQFPAAGAQPMLIDIKNTGGGNGAVAAAVALEANANDPNMFNLTQIERSVLLSIVRFGRDREANFIAAGPQISQRKLLRFQLSLLTTLKTALGNLVSVNVVGSEGKRYPVVDLNNAKDFSGVVLENVKKALSGMRAFMPKATVDLFENINNYGSVFWLQSHMMDQLFGNNNDAERQISIKAVNNNLKNAFIGTLAAVNVGGADGSAFEALYDLCYWRMRKNALAAEDLQPVGNKGLPFPGNVIELVDDLDPVKGTLEKQNMEKKYAGIFNGYLKAVVGVVERKTADAEARPGRMGMLGNQAANQPGADIDNLAELKPATIQDSKTPAERNFLSLRRALDVIKREATELNRLEVLAGRAAPFAAPADPAAIDLTQFNLRHDVTGAEAEGKTSSAVAVLEFDKAVRDFISAACQAINNIGAINAPLAAAVAGDANFAVVYNAVGVKRHVDRVFVCSAIISAFPGVAASDPVKAYLKNLLFGPAASIAAAKAAADGADNAATVLVEQSITYLSGVGGAAWAAANGVTDPIFGIGNVLVPEVPIPAPAAAAPPLLPPAPGQMNRLLAANVTANLVEATPVNQAAAAPINANAPAGPANLADAISNYFVANHQIGASYAAALAIVNIIPALAPEQTIKLQRSQADAAFVAAADIAMKNYIDIASGAEQDLGGAGATTTLIFNTLRMNDGFENNTRANSSIDAFGIVPMFNRTLQQYMDAFFDKLSSKFYTPLIEEFATGHFSSAIVNKKAYNDTNMLNDGAPNAGIGLVRQGTVVASSNARGIRVILNKRDDKGVAKLYALNSLADVSPQMKEIMRANLPLFRSAFRDLYDQAEILKKLVVSTSVKEEIKYNMAAIGRSAPIANSRDQSAEQYLNANAAHPELSVNYFKQALEQVQLACELLVKSSNQVYKELNDAPLFGETYNGSLAEFKQKAQVYPVTPVSIAQHFIKDKLMPNPAFGSNQFKLAYALRGFGDFQISKAPGYEELLRMYNITVPEGAKMNPKYFEEYTKTHVPLLQALIRLNGPVSTFNDTRNMLGGLFSGELELKSGDMLPNDGVVTNYPLKPYVVARPQDPAHAPPAINRPEITNQAIQDDLISLLTNTDAEYERERFVTAYAPIRPVGPQVNQRSQIQYRNLIETGIVPVNINALQREVPLVNLLNYAYTFEKIVIDSLGVDLPAAPVGAAAPVDEIVSQVFPVGAQLNANNLMAYSLVYPYGSVPAASFDAANGYKKMLVGVGPANGRIRLERPKFISDQIWNKLCVRHLMDPAVAAAPAGPVVGDIYYLSPSGEQLHTPIPNLAAMQPMGKRRFDTVLVRNLVWTVQLHRFLTWSIKEKTRKVVNPVSQGEDAYDPTAVEFYGTEGVETYPL